MNERQQSCFIAEECGVTSIEYALLASLIAIACVFTVIALGGDVNGLYTRVCGQVTRAVAGTPAC